ncbi:MAG TPA: hypothetical protein VGR73_04365 [Bryobacteraceae bacterium]|nr:hypothetical protein [Bryobacteraceae bacterium]
MRHHYSILLVVISVVAGQVAAAADLQKVWELDLRKLSNARGVSHTRDLPVLALRFAPDGSRVAAIIDLYGPRDAQKSHLFVIDAHHPEANPSVYEVSGKLNYDENGPGPDNFGWSPTGQIVYAGGAAISVGQGKGCELPWRSLFVTDNLAITEDQVPVDWTALASHFTLFDRNCQPRGKWDVPERWIIVDTSPDLGLLSVSRLLGFPNKTEALVVDPLSRKVIRRWSGPEAPGGQFADRGTAICRGSDVEAAERAPVICWEVDTGKKINEAPAVNGGDPIATALHASRIIASDYGRRKVPLSSDYVEILKRRVLWDFRTGKELASWRPRFQSWEFQLYLDPSKPLKRVSEPFRFAISPDGEYIAEGGSGEINLYKIEQ